MQLSLYFFSLKIHQQLICLDVDLFLPPSVFKRGPAPRCNPPRPVLRRDWAGHAIDVADAEIAVDVVAGADFLLLV